MTIRLTIALSQRNVTVGDFEGNVQKISEDYARACQEHADLLVSTELSTTGYAPEDLVLFPEFQKKSIEAIHALAALTREQTTAMLVGGLYTDNNQQFNVAYLLEEGAIQHIFCKYDLPNYGVFDEKRVFYPGPLPHIIEWREVMLGILICEDVWNDDVISCLAAQHPQLLVVLNASPFEIKKTKQRLNRCKEVVNLCEAPLIYTNQIGAQDEVIYDGGSFVMDQGGSLISNIPYFEEGYLHTEWVISKEHAHCRSQMIHEEPSNEEAIYLAMMVGLRDYIQKNRFPGVCLGLSGGMDSSLSAIVAADALGHEYVHGYLLPSPFTSKESIHDAENLAKNAHIKTATIPITPGFETALASLSPVFGNLPQDLTEENIQARLRGMMLMAISNKFNTILLSTGNKSEIAVGYATLYGDMCGGYNVLKDIYKTEVYRLAAWRNTHIPKLSKNPIASPIPEACFTKAPTAELRHHQTDQDSLPPYDILDGILKELIEHRHSRDTIIAKGFNVTDVDKTLRLVYASEYKRRQAAPGVKVSSMHFGRDRRYPITNRFNF